MTNQKPVIQEKSMTKCTNISKCEKCKLVAECQLEIDEVVIIVVHLAPLQDVDAVDSQTVEQVEEFAGLFVEKWLAGSTDFEQIHKELGSVFYRFKHLKVKDQNPS